jgi:hypothetical protein
MPLLQLWDTQIIAHKQKRVLGYSYRLTCLHTPSKQILGCCIEACLGIIRVDDLLKSATR